jgi:cellulose synthase (UDP-forming)
MLPHHSQYSKYSYIVRSTFWLKIRYIVSLVAFLMTLIGNYYFLSSNPLISITFGSVFALLTMYFGISYSIVIAGYKKFNLKKHNSMRDSYWLKSPESSVDVFLPICGEDLYVLKNTWQGVKDLNYGNFTAYVLDDKGSAECEQLAKEFGFQYLSRPNKGEMKKAGNLKYAFDRSKGDFIVIFDADFRPHPDFLFELLPYMTNEKYGIIQSPQYFAYPESLHTENFIEYGAGAVQEDFYKVIQTSRNTFKGSICVGSNAIYRRSALNEVGGTAQVEHSEDVRTGFRLWTKGYETRYVPLILASGLCPNNYTALFKQQNRWCSGSMDLLRSQEFWKTKMPLMMRICYMSGMSYYISQFTYFFLPLQIYLVLWLYGNSDSMSYIWWFLPAILNGYFLVPSFRITRLRFGGRFVYMAQRYIYTFTVLYTLLLGKTLGWTPTGEKQKMDVTFDNIINFSLLYSVFLASLAGVSYMFGKIDFSKTSSWFTYYWILFAIVSNATFGIISKSLLHKEQARKASAQERNVFVDYRHLMESFTFAMVFVVVGGFSMMVITKFK